MGLIIDNFGEAQEIDIQELESKYNIIIPEDYRHFLLSKNGGRNTAYKHDNSIVIPQIGEMINIDIMFGINTGEKNSDIDEWTSEYNDDLFKNSIIIGDTIQHGFLVFWLSGDEDEGIYYYDDTYELESSDDENNAYFLTKSFSEFLATVNN